MICSHLNPSSVMHLHAMDLDDLRSLVSSRGSDTHVHLGVDAQTGLGTMPPRPHSTNIGLFHIALKNKECSSVSSWKICSQPQTRSALRMTVPLTSTLAVTRGNTIHNSLTTSYHLTTVCVPGPSTHRPQNRIIGD